MKVFGNFTSARWGKVAVLIGTYVSPQGPLAVALEDSDGEPLTTLSVNMYRPASLADSRDLPRDCFYMKDWSENEELAREAQASELFIRREDLPNAISGFVMAKAWQLKGE